MQGPAARNMYRIAKRIDLMECLFNELSEVSIDLEDKLEGHGKLTNPYYSSDLSFSNTMAIIRNFLRILSGEAMDEDGLAAVKIDQYLWCSLKPDLVTHRLGFDDDVEPFIVWLENTIHICKTKHSKKRIC